MALVLVVMFTVLALGGAAFAFAGGDKVSANRVGASAKP